MTKAGGAGPPERRPHNFEGWQRSACVICAGLVLLFTLLLLVAVVLGLLGTL
ncbi:MAG: hypothetical protein ACREOL_02030 [Candidatus Dormibacteria bacterium]